MHFTDCRTPEEIKARFRKLAKELHPDTGGSHEAFIELTEQYHQALASINGQSFTKSDSRGEYTYKYDADLEAEIVSKIDDVLRELHSEIASGSIDVWLIGRWLWLQGETKPIRAKLGKAGLAFRWHRKRVAWYWHSPRERRSRYAKGSDLADIASKYGASKLAARKEEEKKQRRRYQPAIAAA